ncbi:hypothetical protein CBL_20379 [Carabus blaptoides fortunei]
MSSRTNLKACVIPMCQNSTLATPNKIFFHLPKNPAQRNKWVKAIGFNVADFPLNLHRYCCEDHFDVQMMLYLIDSIVSLIEREQAVLQFFEDATKRVCPEFVDGTASASTSTLTEYVTQASSSGNMFCETNIETLNLCNKPSTSDTTSTHKTCATKFNLSDKPFVLSKGVQDVFVDSMTSPIKTFQITTPMKECQRKLRFGSPGDDSSTLTVISSKVTNLETTDSDGLINFVSKGYSGRITDALLVEKCGYLDCLSEGVEVMADRGFKHIEQLIIQKGCKLVCPPSVYSNVKSSKFEVLESKRIASLRIHVERVIRRISEFKFFEPHATIDNHLIPYTDNIITTAAALINLQGPLRISE